MFSSAKSKMRLVKGAVAVAVGGGIVYKGLTLMREPPIPKLAPNPWWGPGNPKPQDSTITPFKISIPQDAVDDLKVRLSLPLRLTPPLEDANFTYGMSTDTLRQIVHYWLHEYDWQARETRLNSYPHYKTNIEGLDIHFMHIVPEVKNPNVKVVPLLLIHGWPGSFVEFYDILPLLTTPQEGSDVVFEVICPSIPGYGFSEGSNKQGLGYLETSQIFLKLMKRLGHEEFYIQGGDWGSYIGSAMATMYPQNVQGIHLNMFDANTGGSWLKKMFGSVLPAGFVVSKQDEKKLYPMKDLMMLLLRETGYLHLQATKPDTVGVGLNESPVGLASYLLEKFSTGTHLDNVNLPDGGLLQDDFPISLDALLDNICIYWFTGSITTSMRFYAENINLKGMTEKSLENIPCRVPTGLTAFPQELLTPPENLAKHKYYDIVSYKYQPSGGHFAAMESPLLLAEDVHQFVTAVEKRNATPT